MGCGASAFLPFRFSGGAVAGRGLDPWTSSRSMGLGNTPGLWLLLVLWVSGSTPSSECCCAAGGSRCRRGSQLRGEPIIPFPAFRLDEPGWSRGGLQSAAGLPLVHIPWSGLVPGWTGFQRIRAAPCQSSIFLSCSACGSFRVVSSKAASSSSVGRDVGTHTT